MTGPSSIRRRPRPATAGTTTATGDLDGDGFADLLVGSGLRDRAWFVRGPFAGASILTDHAYGTIVGTPEGGLGRRDTLSLADVTGDGHPDLWVGEPKADVEELDGGAVHLLPAVW